MTTPSHSDPGFERLIRDLATDLPPVRPLRPPFVRALVWLAAVAAAALVFASFSDLPVLERRLGAAPDMWLAAIGSAATAILAALAAFRLSVPDAPRRWAALPLPSALVWIGASGFGCLRTWLVPGTQVADLDHARDCLVFIVGLSVPLSALLVVMLRRACPLAPGLTAAVAGLAAAAAAATLLLFFHPFDAAATDLTVHAGAVALVIAANRAFGRRLLGGNLSRPT
ncbi:MAG TPA: NrsF family protein [Xanthobacteraceae bacterium]|nr:NrsF family protein [Xanthobacteraceae bacterium]